MNYFKEFKINDHIYQFKDPLGVLCTLVIGKKQALLIDTTYGIGNLPKLIAQYTTLPLIVIDSHGHMDHSCGNYQFSAVYLQAHDLELCKLHNSYQRRLNNIEDALRMKVLPEDFDKALYLSQTEGNLLLFEENLTFDLGGLHVQTINMEGHTAGSVGILIEEDHILVVTDATCPFVWLFLEESLPLHIYVAMLERTLTLPFNHILLGHGAGALLPKAKVIDFYNTAKSIDLNEAVPVKFNHFENANAYCYTKGKMYDQNDVGIVFDPHKL